MTVTDRILHPRGMAGKQRTAGELLAIASSDTQRVADAVIMTVFPFAEITSIIYVAVMVSSVNLPLGLGVLLGGPVVVMISLKSATRCANAPSASASFAAASATATDVVQGFESSRPGRWIPCVRDEVVSDKAYEKTVAANGAQARLNAVTETAGAFYVIIVECRLRCHGTG